MKTLYYLLSQGFVIFQKGDIVESGNAYQVLKKREDEVDEMIDQFLENQSQRVKDKKCSPSRIALYSNILTDVKRMFDHMIKIVLEGTKHHYAVMAPVNEKTNSQN